MLVMKSCEFGDVTNGIGNLDLVRSLRVSNIRRYDRHLDSFALLQTLGPCTLQNTILAGIKIGVLREVVEGVGWAIEAGHW